MREARNINVSENERADEVMGGWRADFRKTISPEKQKKKRKGRDEILERASVKRRNKEAGAKRLAKQDPEAEKAKKQAEAEKAAKEAEKASKEAKKAAKEPGKEAA